jgi:hypothetical protein
MQKIAIDPYWKNLLLGMGTMGALGAGIGATSGWLKRDMLGISEEDDLLRNPYFHTLDIKKRRRLLGAAKKKESRRRIRSMLGNMLLGGLTAVPAGVAYGHILNTGRSPLGELVESAKASAGAIPRPPWQTQTIVPS